MATGVSFKALTIQSGTYKRIGDTDTLRVGDGIDNTSGNLTVTAASSIVLASDVTLAAGKNFTPAAGAGAFDFSAATGIFKTSTGAVTVGPGATTLSGAVTFTAAGTALTVNNNAAISGTLIVTGEIAANGGLGRSTSGALIIGADTESTSVEVGKSGALTTVKGDLQVDGTETIVGTSTFQSSATFEGNVTFGNASTDTVAFISRIGPTGNLDLHFVKELNHTIDVDASTTAATAGGNLTLKSGAGSTTGAGGALTFTAGAGGATGVGGAVVVEGGAGGSTSGNGGALTLRGGSVTSGTTGVVTIGATNTSAIAVGASGITTTVTGGLSQLTGAVSLTANAASSFTTSSGALTLTAAAASTWSTSAGALTLTSAAAATWSTAAGALTLNGTGGINFQGGATTALTINSAGTAITVQAGAVLATTGSGNINLPNNGSARFQIESTAVGSTVTAPNLDTLTNGSNADALHVHATGASEETTFSATSGEAIAIGALVAMDDSGGSPRLFKADANGAGELVNVVGIAHTAAGASGVTVTVIVAGQRAIPDAQFDSVPAVTDVGKKVFLSETAGNWTLTAPSTSGSTVIKTGIVSVGGTGAVKVVLQIGEGVVI